MTFAHELKKMNLHIKCNLSSVNLRTTWLTEINSKFSAIYWRQHLAPSNDFCKKKLFLFIKVLCLVIKMGIIIWPTKINSILVLSPKDSGRLLGMFSVKKKPTTTTKGKKECFFHQSVVFVRNEHNIAVSSILKSAKCGGWNCDL